MNRQKNKRSNEKRIKVDRTQVAMLRKLIPYIGRYKTAFLLSILTATISVALTLYIPILSGQAIDFVIAEDSVDFSAIFSVLKKIVLAMAGAAFAQWIMNVSNNRLTYLIVRDLREDAIKKIEILPIKAIDMHSHGDLVSCVIADVDLLAEGLLMGFNQLFTGTITIIGTLLFLLSVNVKIALNVVLFTPVSLFVANAIAQRTFTMFQKQSKTRGKQTAFLEEMIGNQKTVQAFSHEKIAMEQFDVMNEQLEQYSRKAIFYSSITNPTTRFINGLVYAGVGLVGAFSVINGAMSVGQLAAVLSYASQFAKPFNEISGVFTELQNALACAVRIFALIEEKPQEPDSPDAVEERYLNGKIDAKEVFFSYEPKQKLIENFQLSVKPGQKVAIVGPTGCGKTTLINLFMRFYEIDKGQILLNDREIHTMTRKSLRKNFGMVLQDTWIKTGTVRENITMGKRNATEEEILIAAKTSHAHEFIKRLPSGYDTIISDDSGSLSQGQKQLLSIARIMLCLPPMLILDEATSSIDTRTERQIQHAFNVMMKERTSFIVAHRLSTIREADMILVMKNGTVIEQGTHKELLAKGGFYANLYQSQFAP